MLLGKIFIKPMHYPTPCEEDLDGYRLNHEAMVSQRDNLQIGRSPRWSWRLSFNVGVGLDRR
jgi:hypothetical protein